MTSINQLLQSLAQQESQLQNTQFLAPCVQGGHIRTRIQGMIYGFTPKPQDFEGWGVFQPADTKSATLIETAEVWQIDEYLQPLATIRVRLAYQLQNQTWLAYPVNEADMRQRLGAARPIVTHLVLEGTTFDVVRARVLGSTFYSESIDRKADPDHATQLQANLQQLTPINELRFSGLTPEMRTTYELVAQQTEGFPLPTQTNTNALSPNPRPIQRDERRLQDALATGGGSLDRYEDRGDYWNVEWRTSDGEAHTSAISKQDLTVVTAGICLDGFDRDFDLQSLVGVVEQQWDD